MFDHITEATNWLTKLVAMDTRNGTGDEVACVEFLAQSLSSFEPDELITQTVTRSRGKPDSAYVLARWGTPKVLLNVHIDTVPSGEGWTTDPLKLRQDADRLIGLGSSDIKGAAACILAALGTIKPKDVAVLFSGDEEHGSEVMPAVIRNGHTGDAPMAIICEPTGCQPGRRHRGMLAFSALSTGKGGHSSLSDHTAAPLQTLARLATQVGDYGQNHLDFGEPPYKGLCVNIGGMVSDGSYNVIPTEAKLWFSMRPPPGDEVRARAKDIEDISAKLYAHIHLDKIVELLPFESRDPHAFAPLFNNYDPIDLPYWTEAAMLSDAGINAIVYGPGDVDQAHKPNEFVTLGHLSEAMQIYGRALSGDYL